MMKPALVKYLIIFCIGIILTSCYYDVQEELHPGTGSVCDSTGITFSGKVSGILNSNCVGCHSQGIASGGVILDNYNGVKTVADNGRLRGSIEHQEGFAAMPQNLPQLSACDRLTINKWIQDGSPNN